MAQITLRDYLQQTEDAISSSRVDDALAHCQFMLSHFPQALEIQRLLGKVYLAQGRWEDAQHQFDWVLMNDPENVLAYCDRAEVSERLSEYDVALDCYQQACELSRSPGQIRKQFNRLSEKVGQKGFMYSRAGLARLYMRGDMLSQAMQEWDVVLAATPDRLDARTGQLETYWRAGLLEKAEQLADQILHTAPECLKALLLQANIISSKDGQRTQELLHRAEILDPDHLMAQELFADALASQPDDPFFRQLKSGSALLSEAKPQESRPSQGLQQPQESRQAQELPQTQELRQKSSSLDPVISWSTSNSTTLQAPQNTPVQETMNGQSSQETYTGSQGHSLEPWELLQNALNQFDTNGAPIAAEPRAVTHEKDVPLWENMPGSGEMSQPSLYGVQPDSKPQESTSLSGIEAGIWSAPAEKPAPPADELVPNPPSWLNMFQADMTTRAPLTADSEPDNGPSLADTLREQQAQPNTTSSEVQNLGSLIPSSPSQPLPLPPDLAKAESQPSWLKAMNTEQGEEDEESFFGPSWLKSLGATSMTNEEPPVPSASEAPTQYVPQPKYTDPQHNEDLMQVPSAEYTETPSESSKGLVPEANPYEPWSQTIPNNSPNIHDYTPWSSTNVVQQSQNISHEAGTPPENTYASGTLLPPSSVSSPTGQPAQGEARYEATEQNLLTTLEELEQSLRSKGFIPLEPNSLSTLATHPQESSVAPHDLDASKAPEEDNAQNFQQFALTQEPKETQNASSLSSALAQLGNLAKEPSAAQAQASSFETSGQGEEPSWLQALKYSPATSAVPTTPILPDTPIEPSAPAAFANNMPPATYELAPQEPAAATTRPPTAQEPHQTVKVSIRYDNPLLDGELETTMKRPAIRLQPIQQPTSPSSQPAGTPITTRPQSRERMEKGPRMTKPTHENLSYRDRLVKGYQHQLVGDYDEAMQEYRLIIRSGTDLLSEVVSNVRALLKLAPSYSAGYRVLGDAYMRQGEYLQAMEAYNKALTMTKKVKSQA
jgi:tetratricopeptide (TPR) repeat protein